jgi:hypothetical protein
VVTRTGQEFYYENFKAGWGKHPEHPDLVVLGVTDIDNEEIHLFPMTIQRFEQLAAMGHQTAAGIKIMAGVPSQLPDDAA